MICRSSDEPARLDHPAAGGAHALQHPAVVRDQQQGALVPVQRRLQLLDRGQIQVVRRLVEHQQVDAARLEQGQRGVNLLVLDEPTNHLDLPAIEQLEQAMESFDGTILLVTHDRRMLDTVRLTRRWHVEDGRVTEVAPD